MGPTPTRQSHTVRAHGRFLSRTSLLPRASATLDRYGVRSCVSHAPRTLHLTPIRPRVEKKFCDLVSPPRNLKRTWSPTVTSTSHGHVHRLIDLVSSSSIDTTVVIFTDQPSKHGRKFLPHPLSLAPCALRIRGEIGPHAHLIGSCVAVTAIRRKVGGL